MSEVRVESTGASGFDAFYRNTRDRLLLQTFALTGDLSASRRAVRDTFVVAWHHWPKISHTADPEAWARPHAWAHALRRKNARPFHRERHLDPIAKDTLDALATLSTEQRRVLLLNHLVAVDLVDLAREAGLTLETAESTLQHATAGFAHARGVPSTSIRPYLDQLAEEVAGVRWPRHTIIRRAGSTRRRVHTVAGVSVTVAALIVSGTLVTDPDGARPTLTRETVSATTSPRDPATPPDLPMTALLPATALTAVRGLGTRPWVEVRTHDNAAGNGRALPCQGARYADTGGSALLVRDFRSGPRRAYQLAETSAGVVAAQRAFETAESWFAGCEDPGTQLLATYDVPDTGDEARLFVLRDWTAPARSLVIGIARTGQILTATATSAPGTPGPIEPGQALLRAGVEAVCGLPAGGACVTGSGAARAIAPLPLKPHPELLGVVDLPPVTGVSRPWQGSEVTEVTQNVAATRCDRASFTGEVAGTRFTRTSTRTFLIPGADLPPEFGLTESTGVLDADAAARFVTTVRDRLARCSDRQIGTEVTRLASSSSATRDLTAWRVVSQVTDDTSVTYLMAILRDGPRVAQVGFIAAPRADLTSDSFVALARRALDRLGELDVD